MVVRQNSEGGVISEKKDGIRLEDCVQGGAN